MTLIGQAFKEGVDWVVEGEWELVDNFLAEGKVVVLVVFNVCMEL